MSTYVTPVSLDRLGYLNIANAAQLVATKSASQIFAQEIVDDPNDQIEISNEPQITLIDDSLEDYQDVSKPLTVENVQQDIRSSKLEGEQESVEGFLNREVYGQVKRYCDQHSITPTQALLAAFHAFCVRCVIREGKKSYAVYECGQGAFVETHKLEMEDDLPENFDALIQDIKSLKVRLLGSTKVPRQCRMLHQALVWSRLWNLIITDDLALETMENAGTGLKLRLVYPLATYSSDEMQQPMDNFLAFWSSIVANPHQILSGVPLCGENELLRQKNIYWSQHTTPNTWNNTTVVEKILQVAREYPQGTAVITSDGETLTYKILIHHARRIAFSLQQSGAIPGSLIGLLCRPGLNEITGMVAILLCRCGYVAMDPNFAAERLSFMANDSNVPLILVDPDLMKLGLEVAQKSTSSPRILSVLDAGSASSDLVLLPASPQDPFYTIYTSGSTGIPKGVVLTSSNTQQMLSTLHHDYKFSRFDRFLHHSSLCFDLSVVEIFSALTCGGTVCVGSARIKDDPESLCKFMKQVSITFTYFTPTKFALLLESCQESLQQCLDYRIAFFAGERLPARVVERFYALQLRATMYNTWSPSELVVQTAIHKVSRDVTSDTIDIPIGFPMANCAHYILDSNLNPVPIGVVGEICVGGAQVGRGYINAPEEKSKAFAQNPFAPENYVRNGWTRIFRTGDKGRFLCNGELEFHGRIAGDKQIKLRGFRIDLGEIEQRIFETSRNGALPRLINVHVVARPVHFHNAKERSMTDDRQLIAYLVLGTGSSNSERQNYVNAVHQNLRTHLNSYMLPNGYEVLDRLPVTIGGKVDIRDLHNRSLNLLFPSALSSQAAEEPSAEGFDSTADPTLSAIIDIFKVLLSLAENSQVNPKDNFFALGGQSMLLLRLQARLKTRFGVKVPLPSLFKDATPAAIAQMVRDKQTDSMGPIVATTNVGNGDIDWQRETTLPEGKEFLAPQSFRRLPRSEISTILVTGADSFIGVHLIATILTIAPSMTIFFLGSSQATTLADLKICLGRYQLLNNAWSDLSHRLIPVAGTLAKPRFGLDEQQFTALGHAVQAIYHIGGEVSLLKSYHDLKPFNVSPTLTLISLAHHGSHLTELHYLSTWSVPHLQTWHDTRLTTPSITTAEEPSAHFRPSPSASQGGYLKARWASEALLTQASHRGFHISLYRASAVTANSATRVPEPVYDLYRYTIMRMIQARCVPDTSAFASPKPFAIDFVPVDFLAASMFDLSRSDAAARPASMPEVNAPLVYHIGNPAPLLLKDLPPLIPSILPQEHAVPEARVLPLEEWLGAIGTGLAAGEELRVAAIRELFGMGHCAFSLDRTRTAAALEVIAEERDASGVSEEGTRAAGWWCPPVGVEYLRAMVESSW